MTTAAVAGSPVQDAVFDALNVAAFTALASGGFFTDVPQGTAFPLAWLTFGTLAEEPLLETFGKYGVVCHLELHVFSDYEGDDQALDIMSKAAELLHHAALTVTGFTVPHVQVQPSDLLVEDYNGKAIRHGLVRIDVSAIKS